MLVEIFVFNLFFAKKLKNAKMQKSMKFAAKFSKNMSFFKFAPKSWSKGRAFVVSSTQNHQIIKCVLYTESEGLAYGYLTFTMCASSRNGEIVLFTQCF